MGGKAKRVDVFEMVRMIAAARIILPKTMVRLSRSARVLARRTSSDVPRRGEQHLQRRQAIDDAEPRVRLRYSAVRAAGAGGPQAEPAARAQGRGGARGGARLGNSAPRVVTIFPR